ncbi:MAG: alanine racemase [Clostridia bacterium]|nr:alanine racemase [Clostridia bacterium]
MTDFSPMRATALIDTAALMQNYQQLSAYAAAHANGKAPRVIAIVKANAYGHDLRIATGAFLRAGCDFFGVATLKEALTVRKIAPSADILILGYTPPQHAARLAANKITQTVFSAEYTAALAHTARLAGTEIAVHIKLDCGMHRLGFSPDEINTIATLIGQKGICPTGIYTHFPNADTDIQATTHALARFLSCRAQLASKGYSLFAHAAASAALLTLPDSVLDGVRPGLALYGISPVKTRLPLCPALSLFSTVVQIHDLPSGTPLGYGGAFVTERPTRIGTVPIGYGDGISRAFSGETVRVFHNNVAFTVPIVGRICMDYMMLDLGNTPVKTGDPVQIFYDIRKAAAGLQTIPYELLTTIGPRIKRKEISRQCSSFTRTEKQTSR